MYLTIQAKKVIQFVECSHFTLFYGIKKKLENVGNLQVARTQDLDGKIQITGTRMISQSDSKIGSQTAEKVEKKRKKFTTEHNAMK